MHANNKCQQLDKESMINSKQFPSYFFKDPSANPLFFFSSHYVAVLGSIQQPFR
jgi:hypothetical protein